MARRFVPRLSFANVISVIALFVALGGGYATAFSGSGTLQKAASDESLGGSPTPLRTLNGFGTLQGRCGGGNELLLSLNNTTSKQIHMAWSIFDLNDSVDTNEDVVNAGTSSAPELSISNDVARLYLTKLEAENKAQVDVVVRADTCSTVRILALNTQE